MASEGAGSTRGGGDGLHNEDAFVVEEGLGLYVVCDGASGTPAGEIAARVACAAVEAVVAEAREELRSGDAERVVARAMHEALAAVAEAEQIDPELRGLATTVTMLLVQGRRGVIGHRGDSRAYLIRRGRAQQLTYDSEFTESVANGHDVPADTEVFALALAKTDTLVLCTDGAEEVVADAAIVRAAATVGPRVLASRIVSAAHARSSSEDATAVVVRVSDDPDPGWLELSGPARGTSFGHTLQPRSAER